MSLFSQMVILVLSLAGILCGIALSYIAPEELSPGKKYFLSLKWLLWIGFIILSGYLFYARMEYFYLVLMVIGFLFIYILELTSLASYTIFLEYLMLIGIYFLLSGQELLLGSIIFLYGLPTGTLLKIRRDTFAHETKTG